MPASGGRQTFLQAILKSLREIRSMAKLVFGMNQALDGYVDHMAFAPSPTLFRHFVEEPKGRRAVSAVAGCMRSCATGKTIILNGM
jgi:hypothetical protein